ncbi:hypothetical protein ACFU6I_11580 [Streptomyces sp. NPDC057486]|uniref:hypothetical protein n=1 Tax=Streptomyces sp. NPDC057486 TaxID=3346145 RepID=UPI00369902E9
MDELYRHIAEEEDGLFPASLTASTGDDRNRVAAAWREAHPEAGEQLVDDLPPLLQPSSPATTSLRPLRAAHTPRP